jgi:hypothetical protein
MEVYKIHFLEAYNTLNDWRKVSLYEAQKQITSLNEQ